MSRRVGFLQGRLSPIVDGRIQSFPWEGWREELALAVSVGFDRFEWLIDSDGIDSNPLMTEVGRSAIIGEIDTHGIAIPAATGDYFMRNPYWKSSGTRRNELHTRLMAAIRACSLVGISSIMIPLVDEGRLESLEEEEIFLEFFHMNMEAIWETGIRITIESDYLPDELARLLRRLPSDCFGLTYDMGDRASLGIDPLEDFSRYGDRIDNVHVKDRRHGGGTVPLGEGSVEFDRVFDGLAGVAYGGDFILQTARSHSEEHLNVLLQYREMTLEWLSSHGFD